MIRKGEDLERKKVMKMKTMMVIMMAVVMVMVVAIAVILKGEKSLKFLLEHLLKVKVMFKNLLSVCMNIYNDDDSNQMLLINADITGCRAGALLNQNWKQLSSLGSGYFLESVTINFSPITDATNYRSALYE